MNDTPFYEQSHAKLPEIDESDLGSADVGLYRVRGKTKRDQFYRAITDDWAPEADLVMLARVDDGPTELPCGVERAEIRPDGKRLICDWVMA